MSESGTRRRVTHSIIFATPLIAFATLLLAVGRPRARDLSRRIAREAGGASGNAATSRPTPPRIVNSQRGRADTTEEESQEESQEGRRRRNVRGESQGAEASVVEPCPGDQTRFQSPNRNRVASGHAGLGFEHGQLDWQDRRIGVEGTAFKRISFEISRELSEDFEAADDLGEESAWKDAYVNLRVSKALNLEAGRFKLPFGREELTGETEPRFRPALARGSRAFARP